VSGTRLGNLNRAAKDLGIPFGEYLSRIDRDEKRCWYCRKWKQKAEFGRDRSRIDGLCSACRLCRFGGRTRHHIRPGGPGINRLTGRPGPVPKPPRDGDREQARRRINLEVESGRRPHPNTLPCADCGHIWKPGERRHEYDHFAGYAAEFHLVVQPVCTSCHDTRSRTKGELVFCRGTHGRFKIQALPANERIKGEDHYG